MAVLIIFTLVIQRTTGITGDRGIGLNKIDTLVRMPTRLLGRLRVLIIPKVTVLSNQGLPTAIALPLAQLEFPRGATGKSP